MTEPTPFVGFTPTMLEALLVPGVAQRWASVQEQLHPALLALAEAVQAEAARRFPHAWPLYELSFKSQRFVNRGAGERAPIDEYHFAIDRPPRGTGVYLVISGEERRIIVAIQLLRPRKDDLRRVWEEQQLVWQPLVERLNDVRFAERGPRPPQPAEARPLWIERYLSARSTAYLLAGFAYRWDDPRVAQPDFAAQVIEDVLALFPFNEAIMEQAEALEPTTAAILREGRAAYGQLMFPPIETLVARVRGRGFALDETLIRAYHVALQTKPLVILPGISGTGKTRLTRLYADAVYGIAAGQANEHYLLVAVQPDWHNARDLLGYYNALSNIFHPTPFLRFLLHAAADPAAPHYVCLDEMNLARPEYYLAPILSALETEDHQIDLGIPGETATTTTGETLQNPFRLPLNLRLTGTVNVDENTHTLSDKLLDRANVIELTDVDLEAFRQSYSGPIDSAAWPVIVQIHQIVAQAGQPFGYRTIGEMLRYVEQARGVLPPAQALDQQIRQKILPKLRGEDTPRLRRALTALLELLLGAPLAGGNKAAAVEPQQIADAPFPSSAEKVRRMLERLDSEGFTDFYS